MNANLAGFLTESAKRSGDATAIQSLGGELSYRTLDRLTSRVAGLLVERGVQPGDRIGLLLPSVPEFAAVYYGILRAGAIAVPMNPLLVRREVDYHLEDSGAREIVVWGDVADSAPDHAIAIGPGGLDVLLDGVEPLAGDAHREASDTAVILYTSGTTGRPKGAELSHQNLRRNAEVNRDVLSLASGAQVLGCLPLFHTFGQTCALNATIAAGGTLTLMSRFDADTALDIIGQKRIEVFLGVPTMYSAMIYAPSAAGRSLKGLRLAVSGGAALPLEVLRTFETMFGCPILEGYGLSETSPSATLNRPDRVRKPGSVGVPIDGVEVGVIDPEGTLLSAETVGEVVIRGHNVMKGYWRRPDATAAVTTPDGWFRTGDLGRLDDEGYLYLVGRIKDVIIRGGYNVYPREIEEVALEHPAVREAAVLGVPHERLGEEVALVVSVKRGAALTAQELQDFVKRSVAPYKYPRVVWFLDDLPKGPSGKILKSAIPVSEPAVTIAGGPTQQRGEG